MANRLPQPGGDDGSWGVILNEYLSVSHTADGTLKNGSVSSDSIADGAVYEGKLADAVRQKLNAISTGAPADNSITTDMLQDASVITAKLADSAVTNMQLADGTITDTKIADTAGISQAKIFGLTGSLADKASVASVAAKYVKPENGIPESDFSASVQAKLNQSSGVSQVAGKTGNVTLNSGDVGLDKVDNTSDAEKPISGPTQAALDTKASESSVNGKADDTTVVHRSGDEAISGIKNFTTTLQAGGNTVVTADDARLVNERVPLDGSVTSSKLATRSVDASKLSAGSATAGQTLSYDGTDLIWATSTPSGTVADASPTVKGLVQLSGDLGGVAGTPTVLGLNGVAINGIPIAGHSLIADSSSAASWRAGGSTSVSSANITDSTGIGRSVLTAADATSAKALLGLGNVNNTSDSAKPVSSAMQQALNTKEPAFGAGTSAQYLRGDKTWQTLSKTSVGLGNTDNTSDASKPVSAAAQAALNLKQDISQKGQPNGYLGLDTNGLVSLSRLGGNLPTAGKYLDGSGSWLPLPSGGDGGDPVLGGDLSGKASAAIISDGAITTGKIADGTIVNTDISASAAIAQSKISGLSTSLSTKTDKSVLTAKGDLYVATASASPSRLAAGTSGQVLTVDTSTTTGLKWSSVNGASPIPTDMIRGPEIVLDARNYGAKLNGNDDDLPAIEAMITAAESFLENGQSVKCIITGTAYLASSTSKNSGIPSNSNTTDMSKFKVGIALPTNVPDTAHLTILFNVIKLSENARMAFWPRKKAHGDVFKNVTIDGLIIDNNNSGGKCGIIFGTIIYEGQVMRGLSFNNLTFKNMKVINVPIDTNPNASTVVKKNALPIIGQRRLDQSSDQAGVYYYATNLTFQDIVMEGSQGGIVVCCHIDSPLNMYFDNILIERCRHIMPVLPPGTRSQTSFFVTGGGYGDNVTIRDCYSENIADDSIEIGFMTNILIENLVAVNPVLDAILLRPGNPLRRRSGTLEYGPDDYDTYGPDKNYKLPFDRSQIVIRGCTTIIDKQPENTSGMNGLFAKPFHIMGMDSDLPDGSTSVAVGRWGRVFLEDCHLIMKESKLGIRSSTTKDLGFNLSGPAREIIASNCTVTFQDIQWNYTSDNTMTAFCTNLAPPVVSNSSSNGSTKVTLRDCSFQVLNPVLVGSASSSTFIGVDIGSARGDVVVDGFSMHIQQPVDSSGSSVKVSDWTIIRVGERAAPRKLTIRGVRGSGVGLTGNRRLLQVTSTNSLSNPWIFENNDSTGFCVGTVNDISRAAGTNSKLMVARNNSLIKDYGYVGGIDSSTTLSADADILGLALSAPRTITLPDLNIIEIGKIFTIKDETGSCGNFTATIASSGSQTIDGTTSKAITTSYGSIKVYSTGSRWSIV